jgi:hypothetical protein
MPRDPDLAAAAEYPARTHGRPSHPFHVIAEPVGVIPDPVVSHPKGQNRPERRMSMSSRSRSHTITLGVTLTLFTVLSALGGVAEARGAGHESGQHEGEGHFEGHGGGEPFHGQRGDDHHPGGVDRGRWNGGHWFRGPHLGRDGWWWVVGNDWYGYEGPVYPYPEPAPSAEGSGYWYYCGSVGEYYPYVSACPEGWTPVTPQG